MFTFKCSLYVTRLLLICYSIGISYGLSKYDKKDMENLREDVRQMFHHAYDGYLKYAYPYDELRPLSCDGVDTWGSYSLTLIDALDTLAVMGNYTEFQRVVGIVTANADFDANINVSVFETNIRIIGGLLSAHLLSHRAGVAVEPGWPCNGPLLQLAEDVARRLIAAFDTATGMPYGTVNLRHGVPEGETTVTCTAGAGTFVLEFGTLSRLTGDPLFEEVAMRSLDALYHHRSPIGLVGNHIDVATGRWTAQDAGIGAGVDSYYEYLAKGSILLQRPELMHMFNQGKAAIEKYLKRDDWHLWVSMSKGQVTLPVFQSLEAYWPGVLSLIGDVNKGIKSLHNYHQVWKQYGFTPEFYYIPQGEVGVNRESYPLRPELIESVMYLYRATGDPFLLDVGRDILRSIQHSAKTPCGYATIKDVRDHRKEDRMESFFLAETTKYLYLLFDPDNFIHNRGQSATVVHTPWGDCLLETGGYIFNTEAHPIDPAALHCCSGPRPADIQATLRGMAAADRRGVPLAKHRRSGKPSPDIPAAEPPAQPPAQKPAQQPAQQPAQPPGQQQSPRPEANAQANTQLLAQLHKKLSTTGGKFAHLLTSSDPQANKPSVDEYLERLIVDLDGAIKVMSVGEPLVDGKAEVTAVEDSKEVENGNKDETLKASTVVGESTAHIPQQGASEEQLGTEKLELGNLQNVIQDELYKLLMAQVGLDGGDKPAIVEQEETVKEVRKVREEIVVRDRSGVPGTVEKEGPDGKPAGPARPKSDRLLDYRADDSDGVYPVGGGRGVVVGDCSDDWAWHHNAEALPEFVKQYLLATSQPKTRFDPQALFQRMRTEVKYARNASWLANFEILSCAAQPFVQRLSLSGEMFDIA